MAQAAAQRGITIIEDGSATSPRGFVAGAVYAGIKTAGAGKLDLGILASESPARVAAMFTQSTVKGSAVIVSQLHARNGRASGVIVNAGISNVANGAVGMRDADEMCRLAAAKLGIAAADVLVGSTGIIGRPLPMEKIRAGVPRIVLHAGGGGEFARAIMTTDTHPKTMAVRVAAGGRAYTIGAVAKGVGMIHPDMATMFCFVTTDAPVAAGFLRATFRAAVKDSLNMISVDGDTSTSDTAAIFANGAAGGSLIDRAHVAAAGFERGLRYVCTSMAKMLARDGEGAEKLIEVRIEGAATDAEARAAARTITASPLVKTALHGSDPNWGRVMMAIGRSGARIELGRARVWLGKTMVYRGKPVAFDGAAASAYLRGDEVLVRAHLGAGKASATAWGCDLTPEYVHINADYTT
ncbi:MAG: bifunctional glutamate N-acetyltransferase/amino-acid acetyltransferase ArgJ [Chloroflexota bacterium]|nr:bifunctional glutamate N-acetyltransferase/amino-acid acetyltransferase ArgJ [Chloroflexota bacterium]